MLKYSLTQGWRGSRRARSRTPRFAKPEAGGEFGSSTEADFRLQGVAKRPKFHDMFSLKVFVFINVFNDVPIQLAVGHLLEAVLREALDIYGQFS